MSENLQDKVYQIEKFINYCSGKIFSLQGISYVNGSNNQLAFQNEDVWSTKQNIIQTHWYNGWDYIDWNVLYEMDPELATKLINQGIVYIKSEDGADEIDAYNEIKEQCEELIGEINNILDHQKKVYYYTSWYSKDSLPIFLKRNKQGQLFTCSPNAIITSEIIEVTDNMSYDELNDLRDSLQEAIDENER